jgi:hypothetical protein
MHVMKACGGVEGLVPSLLTSALDPGKWSASRPGRFIPGVHWIGGRAGPRTNVDVLKREESLAPAGHTEP